MSRIGKQPVVIPAGVKLQQKPVDGGCALQVEGPKGKLSFVFRGDVKISVEGDQLKVTRRGDERFERSYHGTARALIANMVEGVTKGFQKNLEIEGVGYNAKLDGKSRLVLQIGYSHPVVLPIPEGLTIQTPKPTAIMVSGPDKQLVGEFAARIRRVRPPEPYKGKGIRYAGEKIIRKAGKTFGSAT